MTPITKSFQYGAHTVTLSTGEVARQALSAVIVDMAETVVLVTVVAQKTQASSADFFPLTIHYQERSYAAGRIPGGFLRREGKATEKETLTSRLIDRPLRPLFTKGFTDEVQVIATVISLNQDIDPDIPSMIGASAALALSGLPFQGPIGAARVGYKDGQYILNPSFTELKESSLDLVVAGTEKAVLMVESEADILPEDVMLGAVLYGHDCMQIPIKAIQDFANEVSVTPWEWEPFPENQELREKIVNLCYQKLQDAYTIAEKAERRNQIAMVEAEVIESLVGEESEWNEGEIHNIVHALEAEIVRNRIIQGEPRIDGRNTKTVRPLYIKTGLLPRTHGSALFTRGETQALVVTTLGTERDAQTVDALEGEQKEQFMLHYNFPPYSVGETGNLGAPKRREIGHGRLAKRGVQAVMPDPKLFPYVIRVVSEITESNGSSSMASVCGASLSLMDAGVPIKAPVAGIAMGLIKEGDNFAVLTDILGDEDHLGDMDFKVAGTEKGVTALQMDIKIDGITKEIMEIALKQAREGRLLILNTMNYVLDEPKQELSAYAPKFIMFKINPEKIRDVIGKGGTVIRTLTEGTSASVDIDDDGNVRIACIEVEEGEAIKQQIEMIAGDIEVGKIYEGKVSKIVDFGAFITLAPGRDGLLHISEIAQERIKTVSEKLKEGDMVKVQVLDVDRQGRIRLSIKSILAAQQQQEQ